MKITKPLLFLDIETTGLSHTKDRIVKLNLAKLTINNEVVDEYVEEILDDGSYGFCL